MHDLDKIRIDVGNFCSDVNKEWYLKWAGIKDELNVSAIYGLNIDPLLCL